MPHLEGLIMLGFRARCLVRRPARAMTKTRFSKFQIEYYRIIKFGLKFLIDHILDHRRPTVRLPTLKSCISWCQNRPIDYSSLCFKQHSETGAPLPGSTSQAASSLELVVKIYRYQEKQPSLECPENKASTKAS